MSVHRSETLARACVSTTLLNVYGHVDLDVPWTEHLDNRTYRQILGIANELVRRERDGFCYQGSDLLHDVIVRLLNAGSAVKCSSTEHLTKLLILNMRRMLIDLVRAANGKKRGGGLQHLPVDEKLIDGECSLAMQIKFSQLIDRLAQVNLRQARVIELRMRAASLDEIATELSISVRTVKRDLAATRQWLSEKRAQNQNQWPFVCHRTVRRFRTESLQTR